MPNMIHFHRNSYHKTSFKVTVFALWQHYFMSKKRPYLVTFQDHLSDNHGPMHQVTFTTDNCVSKLSFEAISLLI